MRSRTWRPAEPTRKASTQAAKRALLAADGWVRSHTVDLLPQPQRVLAARCTAEVARYADSLTHYRFETLHTAHVHAIVELFELGAYEAAMAAADEVLEDCAAQGRPFCVAALRARAERARCLQWLDRPEEAIEEFELVQRLTGEPPTIGRPWLLSMRYCLALARRESGELEASTEDLRALVSDMVAEFGQDSAWMVATVVQLARNLAASGEVSTAIDMVSVLLPVSARLRGPMSKETLTLRSRIARWTIVTDDRRRGQRLAAQVLSDFTRAGLSTCSECCELRYDFAESLFEDGELDYAVAQLTSLRDDLEESVWIDSTFAASVRADLESWRSLRPGGAPL